MPPANRALFGRQLSICPVIMAQLISIKRPQANGNLLPASNSDVFLEVNRYNACAKHQLSGCPACHPAQYMRRRITNAVSGALKRMGLRKTRSIMNYLGAHSWEQVLRHILLKRLHWNQRNPHALMSLTNIAIDHIRPVKRFHSEGDGARTFLCNHYTNLQPLLHEDNHWKSDLWSVGDEAHWHAHILLHDEHTQVYYPQAAPPQPSMLSDRS